MKTLKYLFVFALLPLLSCDNDNDPVGPDLEFGEFSMNVPEDWQYVEQQGYDSKVAQFVTVRKETINYDLGFHSSSLNVDPTTHIITFKTIDGKDAKIVKPKTPGEGTTGVFFENIGNGNRFQMSGLNLSASTQGTLLAAIKTLRFK